MYKLIKNTTKEETICSLVTIDGFDYYVEDREPTLSHAVLDNCYYIFNNTLYKREYSHHVGCKVVLCTNNPNIDIPKVIDKVNIIINNAFYDKNGEFKRSTIGADDWISGLKLGYKQSQQTHPFTEQEIIDFTEWTQNPDTCLYIPKIKTWYYKTKKYTTKELLQIFKEQQIKTIYYE